MNVSKENVFDAFGVGILTKKNVLEWRVSPKLPARSDVFTFGSTANCLVLTTTNDPDELKSVSKFTVWLYRKAKVVGNVSVSFALLDDQDRLHFSVEKHLSDRPTEVSSTFTTFDLRLWPENPQKFFHNGMVRIRCSLYSLDSFQKSSDSPMDLMGETIPREDSYELKELLLRHLSNFPNSRRIIRKEVYQWNVPENFIYKGEARSSVFTFGPSKFWLAITGNPYKWKQSKNQFTVCLLSETKAFEHKAVRVSLAVLDKRDDLLYACEQVVRDSYSVFANFDKTVYENRWMFFTNGELQIHCSLHTDNHSNIQDTIDLRTVEQSEPSYTEKELVADFESLFASERSSDVISCDGKDTIANRVIIEQCSSQSGKKIECNQMANKENISNMMAEVLHELFSAAKVDSSITPELTLSLLVAAEEYSLPKLKEMCSKISYRNLTFDVILKVFVAANRLKEYSLQNATR